MSRIDRLDALARALRDRPGITTAELAGELGVSARSVFRDIEHLRRRGAPIEASRGRGGGVRLNARWGLGRILLSSEEALCALLALAISEKLGFPMFAPEVGRARRKIVDAFPSAERRRITPLRERVFIGQPASAAVRASYGQPAPVVTRRLQAAFVETRLVTIDYVKESGDRAVRQVEPHALLINFPAWYLLGHDRERGATRTFRFDRILGIEVQSATFRPRPRDMAREVLGDRPFPVEPV
jgi:predicted DNA-binding transcriptional regulator YafY